MMEIDGKDKMVLFLRRIEPVLADLCDLLDVTYDKYRVEGDWLDEANAAIERIKRQLIDIRSWTN